MARTETLRIGTASVASLLTKAWLCGACALAWSPSLAADGSAPQDDTAATRDIDGTESVWTLYMEAQLHRSRREYAEAIERFQAVRRTEPHNPSVAMELAWTYFEAGRADSALALASRVAGFAPEEPGAAVLAGRAHLALNQPTRAVPWLRQALELDPEDTWARMNLLGLYESLNRPTDALEILEPEIPEDIATSRMIFRRAELRFQVGRTLDGMRDLGQILRLDPIYPGAQERFVEGLSRMEDPEEALSLIESILAGRPDLIALRRAAVSVLAQGERWPEALPHLQTLARQEPASSRVRLQTALLLLRAERNDEAREELNAAAELDPTDAEPYRWLWRMATESEQWSQASGYADSVLAREPDDLDGKWFRGLSTYQSGDHEGAITWFDQVLAQSPEFREAVLLNAALLQEAGRLGEAEAHLRTYLTHEPQDVFPRFRLGVILERAGRFEQSLAEFDRVLALDPEHHAALNYSGYMWIERGQNLPEALHRVTRACELEPGNPAYEDSYGWGLVQMGRPADALEPLRKAVSGDSSNVIIVKHLGKAYEEAGRPREALETYEQVLELDPSDAEARSWMEGLRERLSRNSPSRP